MLISSMLQMARVGMLRSSMLQMVSSVNDKIIHVTDGVECEC